MPKEALSHIRVYDPATHRDLRDLAALNRRTVNVEGLIAIEDRLTANRHLLKSGPRLSKKAK